MTTSSSDDGDSDPFVADLLALLALFAPQALLERLVVESALNALKHASIVAALRRVDDLLCNDRRLALVLRRVLTDAGNARVFQAPLARDSLIRFVRRVLDLEPTAHDVRPLVKGATFEFFDESLFTSNDNTHSTASNQPVTLLSWTEFVADVALPVVADSALFHSPLADVVFGVLLRNNALNNRIVDDPDGFVRLARAVGASLFDARSARAVDELDRRVALFNELLKLQSVRRAFTDDDSLSGEAALRFSCVVSPHPHAPLVRAKLDERQCCVLTAICAGSNECANLQFSSADIAAMLDMLCAIDLRALDGLVGGDVVPTALQRWLAQRNASDNDSLSRFVYILNAWLRESSAKTSEICSILIAVALFPPTQLARRECIAQLVVAIAERMCTEGDDADAIANPALRSALDDTQLATIDAARARRVPTS